MQEKKKTGQADAVTVGWREWTILPELGVRAIKAKMDTGARTSSLHASFIEPYRENGKEMVRFGLHPVQRRDSPELICHAEIQDRRWTMDTGGGRELRYVIRTALSLGDRTWPVDVNLTDRENLRFRFLVGRTAMEGRLVVDPGRSYVFGRALAKTYSR